MKINEHEYLFRNYSDGIVREIHFRERAALPPVLTVKRDVLDFEEFGRNLVGFLSDKVESSSLKGPLNYVRQGLLLYHFG